MKKSAMVYFVALSMLVSVQIATAAVSFTGSYSQDFNSLITSGTSQAWVNDSTLLGWSLFQGGGTAIALYSAGGGANNTGSYFSFGTGTATDRSLGSTASGGAYFGSPASGAVAGYMALALQNTSGNIFNSFTISYTGEQWRDGGAATPVSQTMVLEYGFGNTFASVASWTAAGSGFNFTSPVFANTGSGAAVDGNAAGQVTGLGGTISSLTWNNLDTLWIRAIERNDPGNDHSLAMDDFSITATVAPVPEPSTFALASIGGLACLFAMRRKR